MTPHRGSLVSEAWACGAHGGTAPALCRPAERKTGLKGKRFSSGRFSGLQPTRAVHSSDTEEGRGVCPGVSPIRVSHPSCTCRLACLLHSRQGGELGGASGKFPDECSVLVSKIKHKFFSEENLYGLWNLEIVWKKKYNKV